MKPILLLFIILFISKSLSSSQLFQDYIYLEHDSDNSNKFIVDGAIDNSGNSNTGSSTGSGSNSNSGSENNSNGGSSYIESSTDKTLLNVTTVVSFYNGKSPCKNSTSCTDIKYQYATHFACSPIRNDGFGFDDYYDGSDDSYSNLYDRDGERERETVSGDWNKGVKYFDDPIPEDIAVSNVERVAFVIMGVVGCTPLSSITTLTFEIQNYQIGNPITTKRSDDCTCSFCVLFYEIPSQPIEMDSYNKSGSNKFQINVQYNTICVTNISIIFYYKPNLPTPTNTSIPSSSSNDNGNHDNPSAQQIKKYIIIAFSVAAAVLLIVGGFIFIRNRLINRNNGGNSTSGGGGRGSKKGYTMIKDGKDIDIHQIKIGVRIGKGNFGEVFLGSWRGSQVAVKKLPAHNINENVLKEFHREINLMKNLRHPNVIQFLGSCSIPPDICICTEFMPRGSLYSILHDSSSNLSWELVIRMLIDAVKGVIYLHGSNPVILHRDLKSHNLLVDENWKVKVADFGLSTIEQQGATMTACGTPCWTSPEVLRSQRYTEKADVYSFGIILWECATRQDPYYGIPPFQVIFAVGREGLRPPTPTNSPKKYLELLADCLSENPSHRPTMEQCLERLETIDTHGFDDIIYSTPTISPNISTTPLDNINNNNTIN